MSDNLSDNLSNVARRAFGIFSAEPDQPQQLADGFTFSQSNLQMFVDCNRRFYLTHVERLPWPALEAAPYAVLEQSMRDGEHFHRLVQRAIEGVPHEPDALASPLDGWMAAWNQYGLRDIPADFRLTEQMLVTTIASTGKAIAEDASADLWRLVAKYDLIAATVQDGRPRVVILDWKTGSRRPKAETLRRRMQSIIYPFVLVEASPRLPFGTVAPEDVEMRYWYAGEPDAPIILRYDAAQHEANRLALGDLLGNLLRRRGEDEFPKVADTPVNRRRFCNYCAYRSRCERGDEPGSLLDYDEEEDADVGAVEDAIESYSIETVTELAF